MILQKGLVGLRLRLADAEFVTKYTFPFIDREWTVPFTVTDLLGAGPRLLRGPIQREGGVLRSDRTAAALAAVESVPMESFGALVHFDPWWDFRGVSGVRRACIEAILASNIARPFVRKGVVHKVYDLEFDDGLGRLNAIIAKDERFRPVALRSADVDLGSLRRMEPQSVRT